MALAGVVGIDPYKADLTPAELYIMAKAKRSEAWDHTSQILSTMHNMVAQKGKTTKAEDFHPFAPKRRRITLNDHARGKRL